MQSLKTRTADRFRDPPMNFRSGKKKLQRELTFANHERQAHQTNRQQQNR